MTNGKTTVDLQKRSKTCVKVGSDDRELTQFLKKIKTGALVYKFTSRICICRKQVLFL